MSPEEYQQLARELGIDRGDLERGMKPYNEYAVSMIRENALLPKGLLPEPKFSEEVPDLSHLNSKAFRTHQKNGRSNGRKGVKKAT